MQDCIVIGGEISLLNTIDGELTLSNILDGEAGTYMLLFPPAYTGATTVVPGPQSQTLNTAGLMMAENITIEPIPSNYGLITWDGTKITVS